jgi:hypothetical protein
MTRAMKQRDREATAAYRAALGAIDNAEAVPVGSEHRAGAIESSVVGVGRADVPRRELTEQDMIEIAAGEAQERRATAELVEATRPQDAERLRREASLLLSVIHGHEHG